MTELSEIKFQWLTWVPPFLFLTSSTAEYNVPSARSQAHLLNYEREGNQEQTDSMSLNIIHIQVIYQLVSHSQRQRQLKNILFNTCLSTR